MCSDRLPCYKYYSTQQTPVSTHHCSSQCTHKHTCTVLIAIFYVNPRHRLSPWCRQIASHNYLEWDGISGYKEQIFGDCCLRYYSFIHFWHAPLWVHSTKRRQQSPEWTIFWATSIASFRERFTDFRSCWVVFIHVVWGCPLSRWSPPILQALIHLTFAQCGQRQFSLSHQLCPRFKHMTSQFFGCGGGKGILMDTFNPNKTAQQSGMETHLQKCSGGMPHHENLRSIGTRSPAIAAKDDTHLLPTWSRAQEPSSETGPAACNSLPDELHRITDTDLFKRRLKTVLFSRTYCH